LGSVTVYGQEKVLDVSRVGSESLSLTGYLSVLEDSSANLSLPEILQPRTQELFSKEQLRGDALSFGYTSSAYWLRLELSNTSDMPVQRLLEIRYAMLSDVQLYQPESGTALSSGMGVPFAIRPFPNRNYVFPLTLAPRSEQVLYVRVQSANSILLPLWLWTPDAFQLYERHDDFFQAAYFGFALAMILFNLFLFFALRDSIYLLYVTFGTSLVFALSVQNGLAAEFLWFVSPNTADMLLTVGYSLALASLLLFMRRMLNLKEQMPVIHRWLNIPVGFFLLAPFALSMFLQAVIEPIYMVATLVLLLILVIGLMGVIKRQRSAYFFVAAFTMFLFGSMINALMLLGFLPTNGLTANALQFGSGLEMLLLSFALADRLNQIRLDNLAKQNQLVLAQSQAMQAQQQLLETLQITEHELEQRVEERTTALRQANLAVESSNRELSAVLKFNETILMSSPLPMAVFAGDGRRVEVNEAYAQLVGGTRAELLATNFNDNRVGASPELAEVAKKAYFERSAQKLETHFINLAGVELWLECRILPIELEGKTHLLVQLIDLTERKRHEEELKGLAFNDSLTRLPNRRLLLDRLKQALLANKRQPSYGAVLFLDLNLFKQLNDTHGHEAGDLLLVEVAARLKRITRDTDTVARFGGDEFVVLLEGLGADPLRAKDYAEQAAQKISQSLSEEYVLGEIRHHGSVSVGIRLFFNDETDPDVIIRDADAAMYKVKKTK
jgi:diguanylate cyclase (GGDEF)-like protein/PAS domain S-box-containing protein